MKIVIWGHPLHSHTHSYVHQGYYDGFKSLGHDVYWFHDDDYPADFDFTNTLFIGEGFADKKIPINDSSTYFIMYLPDPRKYDGVKRLIDVRLTATNCKDHIYDFSFDQSKATSMGPSVWFEPKQSGLVHIKNDYIDVDVPDVDKMYISWATNLLPDEINFDDMYMERENAIYFCGTISPHGQCENWSLWEPFIKECSENGIDFHCNDVWENPLPFSEVQKQAQKSILGADIRGPWHVQTRVVTCRVFKNISYGHLGMTNSEQIYQEMDGNMVYNSDTAQLFHDGMSNRKNYDMIRKGMQYVKENHTYVNRCNSVLKIFEEGE